MNTCFHGSDLEVIEKVYGIDKSKIINFSGNVNPLGISPKLKEKLCDNIELITTYPDRQYVSLRSVISQYVNSPMENILVGNGSTELISLSIKTISPKRALIIGPTYSEYEREINLNGGSSLYFELKSEDDFVINTERLKKQLNDNIDLLVLCNPNNPTSSTIDNNTLDDIISYCNALNIFVVIDETYVEFVDNISDYTAVALTEKYQNLIVLRGVSKFFASPGLRLGYCISNNEYIKSKINEKKNPWTINALASLAGEIILQDKEYISKTHSLICSERNRIYEILKGIDNIKVYKPYANFVLIKLLKEGQNSKALFEKLIHNNMMIRDASTFNYLNSKFFRFCFLLPQQNDKLIDFIKSYVED